MVWLPFCEYKGNTASYYGLLPGKDTEGFFGSICPEPLCCVQGTWLEAGLAPHRGRNFSWLGGKLYKAEGAVYPLSVEITRSFAAYVLQL